MGDVGGAAPAPAPAKGTSLFLQIVEHPDGTISRPTVPIAPPTGDHHPDSSSSSVLSKDIPLNPTHSTFIRIYRPNLPSSQKLPILIFFHGGGFVVFSTASVFHHGFCEQMAAALPALVISLDYRLAPEHRLPAAYEDAVEAILWVRAQAQDPAAGEPWLTSHGDFSRCFLMGSSSGANMAYHAGLRAAALELQPVRLVGLILNQPYFGGVERTPSESASEEDPVIALRVNDMMWHLALPKGADRDHEFSNPVVAPPRPIRLPRCMVKGCQGDPLIDRQRVFVKMLEEEGVSVMAKLDEGGFHAIELFDPVRGQAMFAEVRDFISSSTTTDAAVDATAASSIGCE